MNYEVNSIKARLASNNKTYTINASSSFYDFIRITKQFLFRNFQEVLFLIFHSHKSWVFSLRMLKKLLIFPQVVVKI